MNATATRTALTAETATIGQIVYKTGKNPSKVAYEIIALDPEGKRSFPAGRFTVGVRKVGSKTKVPNCFQGLGTFCIDI